jgi:hypothetical protein
MYGAGMLGPRSGLREMAAESSASILYLIKETMAEKEIEMLVNQPESEHDGTENVANEHVQNVQRMPSSSSSSSIGVHGATCTADVDHEDDAAREEI